MGDSADASPQALADALVQALAEADPAALGCDADLTRIVIDNNNHGHGDGSARNGAATSNKSHGHSNDSRANAPDGDAPNTPAHRGGLPKPRAGPDRHDPGTPQTGNPDQAAPPNRASHTFHAAIHAARRVDPALAHLLTGPSQVLDVGRRTRTIPSGLRTAIATRDHHCRFPGCDIPAQWCSCHHIHHWSNGGPTEATNLILLCHRHHQHVHEGGWTISSEASGQPVFIPPGATPPDEETHPGNDPPEQWAA